MSQEKLQKSLIEQTEENGGFEIELLELFYRLVEKAKYIIAAGLVGAILLGFYSMVIATPTYEATSKLYVMTSQDSAINLSDLQIGSYLTSDYIEVFDAWEVQEMVIQNLGLKYSYSQLRDMVRLTNPSNTRMLYITVTSTNPNEAAAIANEFSRVARQYISEIMCTDEPSDMSQALVPTRPVGPKTLRNIVLGFGMGFVLMCAVIVIQFVMDDRIKSADDIAKYANMPTLAIVPSNSGSKNSSVQGIKNAGQARKKGGSK